MGGSSPLTPFSRCHLFPSHRRCRMRDLRMYLSMNTFESPVSDLESSQGSSEASQYANFRAPRHSDFPNPTTEIPNIGDSANESGHSSGSKRLCSPQRTNPQPILTSSSGGRRRQSNAGNQNAIAELVDIGRRKLELAREIFEYEKSTKPVIPSIPTISACMTRVRQMPGITPPRALVAGEAFRDPTNRELFMSYDDEIAIMWLDEKVAMQQNVYYRQYHPGS